MGIRKHGNKVSQYMTNPTYSTGQGKRPVSGGKSGNTSLNVGNSAGKSEALSRTGDPKGAPAFKPGSRA